MIKQFFVLSVRNLVKNKFYGFVGVLGLSLGFACILTISLFLEREYSFDKHYHNFDKIFRISLSLVSDATGEVTPLVWSDAHLLSEIQETKQDFVTATGLLKANKHVKITIGKSHFDEDNYYYADSNYFKVFSHRWIGGDPSSALDEPNSVVLTKSLAIKFLGEDFQISDPIVVNGIVKRVTGIIEDVPTNSDLRFNAIESRNKFSDWCMVYIKFIDDPDIGKFKLELNNELDTYLLPLLQQMNYGGTYQMEKLHELHWTERKLFDTTKGSKTTVIVFVGIGVVILIVTLVNFWNLLTQQFLRRKAELNIRMVFGCKSIQIFSQIFIEGFILILLSGLSATLALVFLTNSNPVISNLFWDKHTIRPYVVLYSIVAILSISLFSAFSTTILLPTTLTGRQNYVYEPSLRNKNLIQRVSIAFQIAISLTLIFSALSVADHLSYLRKQIQNSSYTSMFVLTLPSDPTLISNFPLLQNEINSLSTVKKSSFVGHNSLPAQELFMDTYSVMQDGASTVQVVSYIEVDETFFETVGYELHSGRFFSERDSSDEVVIVNDSFVKKNHWENPIDEMIGANGAIGSGARVIGVVKDNFYQGLLKKEEPMIFHAIKSHPEYLIVATENFSQKDLAVVKSIWSRRLGAAEFDFKMIDSFFLKQVDRDLLLQDALRFFALLAILICSVGIFGFIGIVMERRIKNISIKMIHGASGADVFIGVLKEYFILFVIALVIALPISVFGIEKWLETFPMRKDIDGGLLFASATVTLLMILFALSYLMIKISRLKPIDCLKHT